MNININLLAWEKKLNTRGQFIKITELNNISGVFHYQKFTLKALKTCTDTRLTRE